MFAQSRVVLLDQPRLYLYVVHGANTFGNQHFDQQWESASKCYIGNPYSRLTQELSKRLDLHGYLCAIDADSNHAALSAGLNVEFSGIAIKPRPIGVNLFGHMQGAFGLSVAARATLKSLQAAGVACAVNNFREQAEDTKKTDSNFTGSQPYPVNLIHTNPDMLLLLLNGGPASGISLQMMKGKYNIGIWAWESENTFPENWRKVLPLFQEIWAPSRFAREAIADNASIPVFCMPHAVDLAPAAQDRAALGLSRNAFVFLFIFDVLSNVARKNPLGVIRAFRLAFPEPTSDVQLIIKVNNLDSQTRRLLTEEIAQHPAIEIIDACYSEAKKNDLIAAADAYIALHRAEGFGLVMAEAMFHGKPVIATGYSGNLDFMTASNSLLVDYRPVTLTESDYCYHRGTRWAEPDVEHAAKLMRWVVEYPEQAKQIGAAAARSVAEQLSPETIGKQALKRLQEIYAALEKPPAASEQAAVQTRPSHRDADHEAAKQWPLVLIATPIKNGRAFLPRYLELFSALDYPRERLSLAFLESDSDDGTDEWLCGYRNVFARHCRRVQILQKAFGLHLQGPRRATANQYRRRSVLAKCRNLLLDEALQDEVWVLWIDADLVDYPADVLKQLLAVGEMIVTPHCVCHPGGPSFDCNSFVSAPGAQFSDWLNYGMQGLVQPPRGKGRFYFEHFRGRERIELDSLGATMLLVKAQLHRDGLRFPAFSYRGFIETEGFAKLAIDSNYHCWGLPDLEICHAPL